MRYSLAVLAAVFAASALAAPHPGAGDFLAAGGAKHRHRHRSVCSKKTKTTTLSTSVAPVTTSPAGYETVVPTPTSTSIYVTSSSSSSVSSISAVSYSVDTSSPLSTSVEFDKKDQSVHYSAWSSAWTSTYAETYASSSTSVYVEPTTSTTAPANTPTPSAPASDSTNPIDIINTYRYNANMDPMAWNQTLADNAQKTCEGSGGTSLTHHLYPGTLGQTMVYGSDSDITCGDNTDGESSFALAWYSWLCEVPSGAGLSAEFCASIYDASNIDHEGQTGHYDILSSDSYKQIGCAFYKNPSADVCDKFSGVWTCDVA